MAIAVHQQLIGEAPPSPAGPVDAGTPVRLPPAVQLPIKLQELRFSDRHIDFVFGARRRLGEVFTTDGVNRGNVTAVTSHPDHARSLFTAKPPLPARAQFSSLRPILGPDSVLIANGPRHLRQRKILLPAFHGEAVDRYAQMIHDVAEREVRTWPVGEPFALAPRMASVTLDVIMSGIFGIEGRPERGTPEHRLRGVVSRLAGSSTNPVIRFDLVRNAGRAEPVGLMRLGVALLDRAFLAVIARRRRDEHLAERHDILSTLMRAETEEGERLTDRELRDELLTLVLAGFETTANQLAWTWERLVRTPHAHDALREAVRSGEGADEQVEATIVEAMRVRPVVPITARTVTSPWRLGEFVVPEGSAVAISILLLHHREDLYPEPYAFRPERFLDHKPGTYEWLPFGGGTRRCLGASLAMAEQRVVLKAMAERLDLEAADPEPERAVHRSVTMTPARGATVILKGRRG